MKLELAASLIALAACGSDGKSPEMADAPDGSADAPNTGPDAPAMGMVTIRLAPDPSNTHVGAAVSFAGPDGHVTKETTTDANGAATATVVGGSSVTMAYADKTLITILDIQPGDNLVLDTAELTPTDEGNVTVTSDTYAVTNPTYTIASGNGLSGTGTSTILDLTADQLDNSKYGLVGMVTASTGPVAYATKFDLVPPANGGPTTVAMPAWKTDFDSVTIALTNAASDAAMAQFSVAPLLGSRFFALPTSLQSTFTNNTAGGAVKIPKGAFTSYQVRTQITSTSGKSAIVNVAPLASLGLAQLDASTMLPFIHGVQLTLPSGAAEPHLAFTADGPLTNGFGALEILQYKIASGTVSHYVITTHVDTDVALPDLGLAQAAYAPASPFTASPSQIVVASGAVWASKRDFRENWFRLLSSLSTYQATLTQPYSITIAQ